MEIRIGTDCSGIEAPIQAIRSVCETHPHLSYHHSFSSEIDPYAIECIRENYAPDRLYGDIKQRDVEDLPSIDLYVAGFSCQPFSSANKFKSVDDPRLNTYTHCIDVIHQCQPSCFILENVITLLTLQGGVYFDDIFQRLSQGGRYTIHWKKMNTKDYGIPQSRKRLYIIGLRKDVCRHTFSFPEPQPMKPLHEFIDRTTTTQDPIKESNRQLFKNIPKDSLFIDVGFRNSPFPRSGEWAPCITAQPNMWCVPMHRKATVHEYLALQGFPPTFRQPSQVSNHQMKIKIGNSMTVPVIELLMTHLFTALDWIPHEGLTDEYLSSE
jgi:site-specific DNA-cytosine methylase